jgi:hypothetical protein
MSVKKLITSNNYISVYLLIILLIDLLLLQLPLAGMLGYEYSAINAALITILSGIYTISLLNKEPEHILPVRKIITVYSSFLMLSFLTGMAGSLAGPACSLGDGVLFFIVITVPSVIVGGSLGLLCYYPVKKFRIILFIVILLLIAAIPAFEFYLNPQIYFYNPLIAYYPGTIYDEGLSVNLWLILYRVFNLLFFGGLFLALARYRGKYKNIILPFVVIIPAAFIILSPYLHFSTSEKRMQSELNSEIETGHFRIYFDPQINKTLQKAIALEHEYCYSELASFFKGHPKDKITSYVFSSSDKKGILLGSENADIAKPWLSQIYITSENYDITLKHELAHIFSGIFADGIFKVAGGISPALIEGIAVAASPVQDEYNVDYLSALAYKNGYKVKLKRLFSYSGFFTSVSTLSYVYAGAFVKYLVDTYGIDKFKKFYVNPDYNKIYNKDVSKIESDFTSYLAAINVSGREHSANYYFGRVSIFQKVCPRYVADRIKTASELYSNKEYHHSEIIFRDLYRISRSYAPLTGMINSLIKLNRFPEADSILSKEINRFKGTGYYYNLELKQADLYALNNNYRKADSLYSVILEQFPNKTLLFIASTRKALLIKNNQAAQYILGNDFDKYMILKELNEKQYFYPSIPTIIELSASAEENCKIFVKQFNHSLIVNDFNSSYAVYRLSGYFFEKLDFEKAARMAALASRYNEDTNMNFILFENVRKMAWMKENSGKIFLNMKEIDN